MIRYRLMARRQGMKEWGIRNDRYHICDQKKNHWTEMDALEKACRDMIGWQLMEPTTEFRLEQSVTYDSDWNPVPRST